MAWTIASGRRTIRDQQATDGLGLTTSGPSTKRGSCRDIARTAGGWRKNDLRTSPWKRSTLVTHELSTNNNIAWSKMRMLN